MANARVELTPPHAGCQHVLCRRLCQLPAVHRLLQDHLKCMVRRRKRRTSPGKWMTVREVTKSFVTVLLSLYSCCDEALCWPPVVDVVSQIPRNRRSSWVIAECCIQQRKTESLAHLRPLHR